MMAWGIPRWLTLGTVLGLAIPSMILLAVQVVRLVSKDDDETFVATRRLTVAMNWESAFQACRKSLDNMIAKAKYRVVDSDAGRMVLSTPYKFNTSGEKIVVEMSRASNSEIEITITSKCIFPTTFYNTGRNTKNVDGFVENME